MSVHLLESLGLKTALSFFTASIYASWPRNLTTKNLTTVYQDPFNSWCDSALGFHSFGACTLTV